MKLVKALIGFVFLWLWACSIAPPQPDNAGALRDIQAGRSGDEVVVSGTVSRVLPTEPGPTGVHERFIVQVRDAGQTMPVLVADNISVAQAAPIRSGDVVVVKGELAFNGIGPVIHWTHRDPRLRHAPGFIQVGGKTYE
ncbi:MAG TPA: DUF3465 domain-containing protein [Candidatus Eremiobacteraceae bacterium]|nr:DUF3465 domain-containing protein [Candidatus Eremiobacteraceae bacterium]